MSVQPIGEIMRNLGHCQWCQRMALRVDSDGELLCGDCRAAIALLQIMSSLPDSTKGSR